MYFTVLYCESNCFALTSTTVNLKCFTFLILVALFTLRGIRYKLMVSLYICMSSSIKCFSHHIDRAEVHLLSFLINMHALYD